MHLALTGERSVRRFQVGRAVLLADLSLHAERAVLHDARDVVPG